jgi:elongator complex protein 3
LEDTPLYKQFKSGEYVPYSLEDMIRVLTEVKKIVPRWVRIMRIQREISPSEIVAGPKLGNIRQVVHANLKEQGLHCKCIRCREIGLSRNILQNDFKLNRKDYSSSEGREIFLSFDDSNDSIYGFLRLRSPSSMAHRKEISDKTCIVRELHVYGKSLKLGERNNASVQHLGLGKKLVREAEKISKEEFDANKLLIISAVGTREYYQNLGYMLSGPYMTKNLT